MQSSMSWENLTPIMHLPYDAIITTNIENSKTKWQARPFVKERMQGICRKESCMWRKSFADL